MQTHRRDETGKYTVTMSLKEHWSCLANSRDNTLKQLELIWARLSRDQEYLKLYCCFLKDYELLKHMSELVDNVEPEGTYYIPHHGMHQPEKSTTKIRVIFDASTLTTRGKSLHCILYNRSVTQDDLFFFANKISQSHICLYDRH